jgi:hypothetical protein
MRLSPAQAARLARLSLGESIPRSEIPKSLLQPLCEAHAVRLEKSGSSYVVRGIPGKLAGVVERLWGVRDLKAFSLASPGKRNRAILTSIASDSKILPTSPLKGIFIRCFGGCQLRGQPLGATPSGSALLVTMSEIPDLRIEAQCLIGVEGVEGILKFEEAKGYFPELGEKSYALVLRWHWNTAWRDWLKSWNGQFFHFPDYDPAGLGVFVNEVLPYRPDARLLIPPELDALLGEHGSCDLYRKQEKLLPVESKHLEVARLREILRRHRKGLEHEYLLKS